MATLNSLNKDFETLKSLFEIPKLTIIYLSDYFSDLKSEVDLAFVKKDIFIESNNLKIKNELKRNWIQTIEQIDTFQQECLLKQKRTKKIVSAEETKMKLIEDKLNQLNTLANSEPIDSNEKIKLDQFRNEIDDLIYDEMFQFEKNIFLNKTMLFLDRTLCPNLFAKIESETNAGKLLYIKNQYFGKRGIQLLKNENCSNEKITNEILRCKEFKNAYKKTSLNNSNIQETQLNLSSLIKINLSNNQLKQLDSSAFSGLNSLQVINLSHNQLTQLDGKIFNGLLSLKSIYLYDNQLTSIDSNLFNGLIKLNLLMISSNQLQTIEWNTFNGLINLTELDLSYNQLIAIHSNLFNGLTKLTEIRLSGNQMTSIDSNTFKGLFQLKEIYLDGNQLVTIDSALFNQLGYLSFVNLARNQLSAIDLNVFSDLKRLERVILSQNKFDFSDKNCLKKYNINW